MRRIATWVGVVLVVAGAAPGARSAPFFGEKVDYASGENPFAIAIGDLNNDTHPDLILYPRGELELNTYLGNGDGTFQPYVGSFYPGSGFNFALGHLNGDEWLDVVHPGAGNALRIRLGDGSGSLGFPALLETPGNEPSHVVLADFNEDGKLDIAASLYQDQGAVAIHLGVGDGTFGGATTFATAPGPHGVATADLNGDGNLDLAVAIAGTAVELNLVSVLLGNGDGTFGSKTDFTANLTPYAITLADLNADGKLDIVTAGDDGKVARLLGNGLGGFGTKTEYPVGAACFSMEVADIDGDGKPDIVATDASLGGLDGRLAVLRGVGDGTFESPVYHQTLPTTYSVAIADLNHDGKLDAVTANNDAPLGTSDFGVSVLLNCVPCTPTAVSVVLDRIEAVDGVVRTRWVLPSGSVVFGTVQRKADGEDWADLGAEIRIDTATFEYEDRSVTPGLRYAYRLSLRDASDAWYTNEAWVFVPSVEAAPGRLTLRSPYPNPSKGGVTFKFGQPTDGPLRLRVFDVRGRQVADLENGARGGGWTTVEWQGRLDGGARASSGVYFAVLEGDGETVRRRFVLAR